MSKLPNRATHRLWTSEWLPKLTPRCRPGVEEMQFVEFVSPLFDRGIVHALTIVLQLRSDIACLIFSSGDAI
jgi:hypothetical protein